MGFPCGISRRNHFAATADQIWLRVGKQKYRRRQRISTVWAHGYSGAALPRPDSGRRSEVRFGGAMSEQTSSVVFRVPDFIDADGIEYTDIEVIVEMDGDIPTPFSLLKRSNAH
jgi:hypothetical protein